MAKPPSPNDKFKGSFKPARKGSSDSRVDFLKGKTDFLSSDDDDDEVLDEETEMSLAEDLEEPELSDLVNDSDEVAEVTVEEDITEEVREPKTGKLTIVSRKITVKKPVVNEEVEKGVGELTRTLITDISDTEVNTFLDISNKQKDQMISGQMQFIGRKNVSNEEKKELLSKLDEITSSDEVSKANAAFVLKWLKKRK